MERRSHILLILLFFSVSSLIYSYDLTYIEKNVPDKGFERYWFETVKDIMTKGKKQSELNTVVFTFEDSTVYVINNARSRSRNTPDTQIIFQNPKYGFNCILFQYNEVEDYYCFSLTTETTTINILSNDAHVLQLGNHPIILNEMKFD
jgi:hypothetical protein